MKTIRFGDTEPGIPLTENLYFFAASSKLTFVLIMRSLLILTCPRMCLSWVVLRNPVTSQVFVSVLGLITSWYSLSSAVNVVQFSSFLIYISR